MVVSSMKATEPSAPAGVTRAFNVIACPKTGLAGVISVISIVVFRKMGGPTIMDNALVAETPTKSRARIVKFAVCCVVGLPVIAPVLAFRVRPAGREPAVIDQVYG